MLLIMFVHNYGVGYEDIGYNNDDVETPHITGLSERGIIFDNSYTMPASTQ